MEIKVEATLTIKTFNINSNRSPEEVVLAVENAINEIKGFKIVDKGNSGAINVRSEIGITGIRLHAERIKEINGKKPK